MSDTMSHHISLLMHANNYDQSSEGLWCRICLCTYHVDQRLWINQNYVRIIS